MLHSTMSVRNALLNGIDATFNSGKIALYGGARPATSNLAPGTTELVEEDLPADALAAATSGSKSKNGTWQVNAAAAGTITWFRLKTAADDDALDVDDDTVQPRIDGRADTAATLGWVTATAYVIGDKRLNNGITYYCTENHTSDADTQPGVGPSFWDVWDVVDMIVDNAVVAVGQSVEILSFALNMPAQPI